jgi:hypothetical protein
MTTRAHAHAHCKSCDCRRAETGVGHAMRCDLKSNGITRRSSVNGCIALRPCLTHCVLTALACAVVDHCSQLSARCSPRAATEYSDGDRRGRHAALDAPFPPTGVFCAALVLSCGRLAAFPFRFSVARLERVCFKPPPVFCSRCVLAQDPAFRCALLARSLCHRQN